MKQLRNLASLSISLAACIGLQSCTNPPTASTQSTDKLQGKLVLTGSSTVAPLAAEIGKSFEAENSAVRVDVQSGGSSRGITDARKGLANIGMVSRALKEDEKDLQAFTIARDGVTIILHKDNPVKSRTRCQDRCDRSASSRWYDLPKAQPLPVVNLEELGIAPARTWR